MECHKLVGLLWYFNDKKCKFMYILSFSQNSLQELRFKINLEEEQFIKRPLTEIFYSPFLGDLPLQFCCVPCHAKLRDNLLRQVFVTLQYLMKSFTSWILYVWRHVQFYTICKVTIVKSKSICCQVSHSAHPEEVGICATVVDRPRIQH